MSGTVRERLRESGIEFALNAFWVAVWGIVVTASIAAYGIWKEFPDHYIWLLIGSLLTFALVIVATWALVSLKRRSMTAPKRVGRPGLLDFVRERDRSALAMNRHLARLTKETKIIGRIATRYGPWLQRANQINRQWIKDVVSRRAANAMGRSAIRMGLYASSYARTVDSFSENTTNWLGRLGEQGAAVDDPKQLHELLITIRDAVAESLPNVVSFRATVEKQRGLSAEMDVAGGDVVVALDLMIGAMERLKSFSGDLARKTQAELKR